MRTSFSRDWGRGKCDHEMPGFLFIDLVAPCISCGTWELWSWVVASGLLGCSRQNLVPWPRIEPGSPALEALEVLSSGPTGKSLKDQFNTICKLCLTQVICCWFVDNREITRFPCDILITDLCDIDSVVLVQTIIDMPKPLTVWIPINCGKFWKRWEYQTTWPASWEICMQVRKQQLELDMEQQTGSK